MQKKAFLRFVGEYIVTPLVFPWSDGCSLGTMVLIIVLNDPVIMVSHFIEGRTSTGSETFCLLICLDANQFALLMGAEN